MATAAVVRHARPAGHDAQPGHVPGRGRHRPDGDRHRPVDRRRRGHRPDRLPGGADRPAVADGPVRQLRRGPGRGPRQGPGRQPPRDPPGHAGLPPRRPRVATTGEVVSSTQLRAGDLRRGRGRAGHPGRRRGRRGRRLGRRVGHHRRERPGDPRGRRRPLRRHRRHPRPLRPDRRPGHRRARAELPRPDDRPGRGGDPPEDAQRDRPDDRPGRLLAHLPDRHRHALPDGPLLRPDARHPDAGRAAGLPDPDDDRRPAGGHRHRRHGPGPAGQHHRQERQGGRGGRRHRHAAAGQDRHDHDRQPPGDPVRAAGRRLGRARWPGWPALASMADQTPEGKSILDLARQQAAVDGEAPAGARRSSSSPPRPA